MEVVYPMRLRSEAMPDNPKRVGVFYGPTLLAADLGPVADAAAGRADQVPVMVVGDGGVDRWVKPVDVAGLVFETRGAGKPRDVKLVPFFQLHDRRHTVFFDLFTPAEWAEREAALQAERRRVAELAARTVDEVRVGEQQPEKDHDLQGEHSSVGEFNRRKWRHAIDGGWFSFVMKVDPAVSNELHLTYWGGEPNLRVFDILVDGEKVATQRLQMNVPEEFFDVVHVLPEALVRGKRQVTVRLQAHPGSWAGGLYGAAMRRAK